MKIFLILVSINSILTSGSIDLKVNNYCQIDKPHDLCSNKYYSYKCVDQICTINEESCTQYQVAIFSINPFLQLYFKPYTQQSFNFYPVSINQIESKQYKLIKSKINNCNNKNNNKLIQQTIKSNNNICIKTKKECNKIYSFDCGQGYCAKFKQTCKAYLTLVNLN